jgi:hypothetical protein
MGTTMGLRTATWALAAGAALVLGGGGCVASRPDAASAVSLGPGPRALVREPRHDFGTVEPGTLVQHRFEIANVGDHPLDIYAVKPSCGCTASLISDRTVWPGKTGTVEVTLDTSGLSGRQSKAVRLQTSDPAVSDVALTVYGEVVADVTVEPRHVYLGRLAPGEVATSVVRVVVHRQDVQITGVATESGQLDVATAPLDPPQQGLRLLVTPRTNGEQGRFSDRLVVRTTSSRQPRVVIPVLASLERDAPRRSAAAGSQTPGTGR